MRKYVSLIRCVDVRIKKKLQIQYWYRIFCFLDCSVINIVKTFTRTTQFDSSEEICTDFDLV